MDASAIAAAHRTALALADAADALARSRFRGPLQIDTKPGGTPVTDADTAIEHELRGLIREAHPDHAVMGEETGGALVEHQPTWVIDPIDGTKNFLRGVPVFATLLALVIDGEAVVGVVSAPALGERIDAALDLGVRRNSTEVGVSAVRDLGDAHVSFGDLDRLRQVDGLWAGTEALIERAWHVRAFGDFWSHAMVASGACDVAVERELHLWDIAPMTCLLREAGGKVTDLDGTPILRSDAGVPGAVVSTNGVLHDEVLSLLR